MMKNTKKAFTLVELIVVITILAILGTIAFISLQGYSQDAKNAKVATDLKTLASAIEITTTKWTVFLKDLVIPVDDTIVANTRTFWYRTSTWAEASGALSTGKPFTWGTVDFAKLGQNSSDFKDSDKHDYLFAVVAAPNWNEVSYQLAGQTKDAAGNYTAVVTGNYVKKFGADADWLIVGMSTIAAWVTNWMSLNSTDLY